MLKIQPYSYPQSYFIQKQPQKKKSNTGKTIAITSGIVACAAICAYTLYAIKKRNKNVLTKGADILKIFQKEIQEFPQDVSYRERLATAVGLSRSDAIRLRPIIGMQEYKNIIKEFSDSPTYYTPGTSLLTKRQDDFELIGKSNCTFRASLHNHTTCSDGKMSVLELLNQAALYADEVAKKINPSTKAKHAPFVIAISDHDTVEGCREAVKIISQNPEKYKNLRVVLGCEFNVENRFLGSEKLKFPVENHIVVNCLNPFDEDLNSFLNKFRQSRILAGKLAFDKCVQIVSQIDKEYAKGLNYNEAANRIKVLKEGLLNVCYSLNQYFELKIKESSLDKQKVKDILEKIHKATSLHLPQMKKSETGIDFSNLIDLFKNKEGYFIWAHPALTNIGKSLQHPEDSIVEILNLFKLFKANAGEKALAAEIHYPYFGDVAASGDWLEIMIKGAKNNELYSTGGLDSHGKSIFYSNK